VHELVPAGANGPVVHIRDEPKPKKNETAKAPLPHEVKSPNAPVGAATTVVKLSQQELSEAISNTKWSAISK